MESAASSPAPDPQPSPASPPASPAPAVTPAESASTPTPPAGPRPKRENVWINLLCNAVVPALILNFLSKENRLGPVWGLLLALSVPLGYGIYDLLRRRKWNVLSIISLVGYGLTGGLGLLKLPIFWFAVKEAAVPLVLGLAVPLSLRTRQPLVRELIYNDQVLNLPRVEAALDASGGRPTLDRLLVRVSWIIAGSFGLSAVLNFVLALWILKSPPGSPEFNAELGRMTALSYPVITLPTMVVMVYAMWQLLMGLEKITGLRGDDLFHEHVKSKSKSKG